LNSPHGGILRAAEIPIKVYPLSMDRWTRFHRCRANADVTNQ